MYLRWRRALAGILLASQRGQPLCKSFPMVWGYVAPEVTCSKAAYDEKCDEWSVGVVAYTPGVL